MAKEKVILSYSGGLDTSVILKWLQDQNYDVVTFTADIGQGDEIELARIKAKKLGIQDIFIADLREELVKDYIWPMFRANAQYEGVYLLGTSIARPLIAKKIIETAKQMGTKNIAHGATNKGNDQIRFELSLYALYPEVNIIAPWRIWDFQGRKDLINYANEKKIDISNNNNIKNPYSVDANLLHISYEGNDLEDTWNEVANPNTFHFTKPLNDTPDQPEYITIDFEHGDPVSVNNLKLSPANLLSELNKISGKHGIGRIDIVENRFNGIKSRGIYETPGGTVLLTAHKDIESITLDMEVAHLKNDLMPKYAKLIYQGLWFSPERQALQNLIDNTQKRVNGTVKLKLFKGSCQVVGRRSNNSLYNSDNVTFESNNTYEKTDSAGFIRINALRLRLHNQNK